MSRTFNNVYRPVVGVIKRTTDKAILLVVTDPEALTPDDEELENWIPKSQIQSITPLRDVKGNSCIMMSEWIIGQKDLQAFVKSVVTPGAAAHPSAPTNPPVKNWMDDMDDDIPF